MKKIVALALAGLLLLGTLAIGASAEEDPDVFMLYDCESDHGNGFQDPWGRLGGCFEDLHTEGEFSYDMQAVGFNGLMFFHNLIPDDSLQYPDLKNYDYVEFDLYSFYEMTCDLELCLCSNVTAHHGSDYEMFNVYIPAEQWLHVRMPLADFVTHGLENKDKWDGLRAEEGAASEGADHYSGYSIDNVQRLRWQFTFCVGADGYEMDEVELLFDNITATRNGATHPHAGEEEVVALAEVQPIPEPPVEDPTDPVDDPTDPVDDPTDPVDDPVDPADDPTDPTDEPTDPVDEPADPIEDPVEPGNNPLDPVEPAAPVGDLDGSGKVDASDALMALKAAVGKIELTDTEKAVADMDGDGKVTAGDALAILKIAVGKS